MATRSFDAPPLTRPFTGILFGEPTEPADLATVEPPDCLHDLNLDQAIAAILAGRDDYELEPFFWAPLDDAATIAYRHEVLRDLEAEALAAPARAFGEGMRRMRRHLERAESARYRRQGDAWFLAAVGDYCGAVERFAAALAAADPESAGLRSLRAHLGEFTAVPAFRALAAEAARLGEELGGIRYTVDIKGDRVRVEDYAGEADYSAEIHATFARFRQGAVQGYGSRFIRGEEINQVEAQILGLVAELHPETFAALASFRAANGGFLDPTLAQLDRELQFYLAYLDHIQRLEAAGMPFCYPEVCERSKQVRAQETFDLALADKLLAEGAKVVRNDWALSDPERIFVVTGPNQGGKTTFARTFGQLHYLAWLGLPVPGREARLFLGDRLFTHFERQEDLSNLSGKLEDDLVRVRRVLERASPRSLVVMNESFSSTALEDAALLGRRVLEKIAALDLLCVYVTFVDELASLNEKTASFTSMVDPADPATRTFKVVRRPADGRAYAIAIAAKYGLTYAALKERIEP